MRQEGKHAQSCTMHISLMDTHEDIHTHRYMHISLMDTHVDTHTHTHTDTCTSHSWTHMKTHTHTYTHIDTCTSHSWTHM